MSCSLVAQTSNDGKIVVTASDYCNYLNSVATNDAPFFNQKMASDAFVGCIVQSGSPGSYTYNVLDGRGDIPVAFVTPFDEVAYCSWLAAAGGDIVSPNLTNNDDLSTLASSENIFSTTMHSSLPAIQLNVKQPKEVKAVVIGAPVLLGVLLFTAGAEFSRVCLAPQAADLELPENFNHTLLIEAPKNESHLVVGLENESSNEQAASSAAVKEQPSNPKEAVALYNQGLQELNEKNDPSEGDRSSRKQALKKVIQEKSNALSKVCNTLNDAIDRKNPLTLETLTSIKRKIQSHGYLVEFLEAGADLRLTIPDYIKALSEEKNHLEDWHRELQKFEARLVENQNTEFAKTKVAQDFVDQMQNEHEHASLEYEQELADHLEKLRAIQNPSAKTQAYIKKVKSDLDTWESRNRELGIEKTVNQLAEKAELDQSSFRHHHEMSPKELAQKQALFKQRQQSSSDKKNNGTASAVTTTSASTEESLEAEFVSGSFATTPPNDPAAIRKLESMKSQESFEDYEDETTPVESLYNLFEMNHSSDDGIH